MKTSGVLSLVDRRILNAVANGRTPTELEKEFAGFSAEEIYIRVKDILSSMDVWDEIEQRKLLVLSLQDLKKKAEHHMDLSDHRQVNVLKDIILAIDKISSSSARVSEEEIKLLVQEQTLTMIRLISLSFGRVRSLLRQEFPEVSLQRIDGVFYDEFERNYNSAAITDA